MVETMTATEVKKRIEIWEKETAGLIEKLDDTGKQEFIDWVNGLIKRNW